MTKSSLVEVRPTFGIGGCSDLSPGKSIREGMGQATNRPASEALDLVITNALIVDWSGIFKVRTPLVWPGLSNATLFRRISVSRMGQL